MNINMEYDERPTSAQLAELHVYMIPIECWRSNLNSAVNQSIDSAISAGFMRVLPELPLAQLRNEIHDQLSVENDPDFLPRDFIFLRSVGRCFTKVNQKQELQLKVRDYLPPKAYGPELFIIEGTYDDIRSGRSSDKSEFSPHSRIPPINGFSSGRQTEGSHSGYSGHPFSQSHRNGGAPMRYNPQTNSYAPAHQQTNHGYGPTHKSTHNRHPGNLGPGQRAGNARQYTGAGGHSSGGSHRGRGHQVATQGHTNKPRSHPQSGDSQMPISASSSQYPGDVTPRSLNRGSQPVPQGSAQSAGYQPPLSATPPPIMEYSPNNKRAAKYTNDTSEDSGISEPEPLPKPDEEVDRQQMLRDLDQKRQEAEEEDNRLLAEEKARWAGEAEQQESPGNNEEKELLEEELEDVKEERKALERKREELIKKAKQLQNRTQQRRNHARDVWKKKYFEEKKRTGPLEDSGNMLRMELEGAHRKIISQLEGSKERDRYKVADLKPSLQVCIKKKLP